MDLAVSQGEVDSNSIRLDEINKQLQVVRTQYVDVAFNILQERQFTNESQHEVIYLLFHIDVSMNAIRRMRNSFMSFQGLPILSTLLFPWLMGGPDVLANSFRPCLKW